MFLKYRPLPKSLGIFILGWYRVMLCDTYYFPFFFSHLFFVRTLRKFSTCKSFYPEGAPRLLSLLLVEARGSMVGLASLDTPENSCLYIMLIFVQNACDQLKHKQTLKHTCPMHPAMWQARQWYGSK